jgi:hypothetical protein
MPGTLSITNCRMAVAGAPSAVRPDIQRGVVKFWCENLRVTGEATLGEGAPDAGAARIPLIPRARSSSSGMGWRVGWVQLSCQEEVWAIYRGDNPSDGTLLAKWPSYETLDTKSSDTSEIFVTFDAPFYKLLSAASPTAAVEFRDIPIQEFVTSMTNTMTRKINTIAVTVAKFSFILALAARDPEDNLHVLKWVPWWVRWESTYKMSGVNGSLAESPVRSRTTGGAGNPQYGLPAKLAQAVKFGPQSSANTLAQNMDVKCYSKWEDLKHLRPLPPIPRQAAPAAPAPSRRPSWERR